MNKIKETEESIFIENIPKLEWGKNTDNSFVRAAQLSLNALGENFTYHYLMGASGAAFRFHFHPDWCPSSVDSTAGYDVSGNLFTAAGYEAQLYKIDDKSLYEIKYLFSMIKEQINRGIPLIAINLKYNPEWGIITGYLKNSPGIICRTYFDKSEDYSVAEHAPWLSFFIGNKKEPLEVEVALKKSLEFAVTLAEEERFEEYWNGLNGFEIWIEKLEEVLNSKNSFSKMEVNRIIYNNLFDSRKAAHSYLSSTKTKLKFSDQLIKNYELECSLLELIIEQINKKPSVYCNEIITQQVEILKKVLSLEKNSINIISKELR